MIRYLALFAVLVFLSVFFAFYPLAETRSQVANVNGQDCSKLGNANLAHPRFARCAAYWANARANSPMNAAPIEANMVANGPFYPSESAACTEQPQVADEAHLYFLKAVDYLDSAGRSLTDDDHDSWKVFRREAVRCLTRAIALDPSNRTYLLKRSEVNDDDPLLKIKDISKVIEAAPDDTGLYHLRATAYISASQPQSALSDYDKAISLEPRNVSGYMKRAMFFYLHMDDKERALLDLNKIVEIDSKPSYALSTRAGILAEKKDYVGALKDLTVLIESSTGTSTSYHYLSRADVYEAAGQLDKALADLNAAIKLSPDSYSAYQRRAKIYRKTRRTALAIIDERTAKRLEARLLKELEEE